MWQTVPRILLVELEGFRGCAVAGKALMGVVRFATFRFPELAASFYHIGLST